MHDDLFDVQFTGTIRQVLSKLSKGKKAEATHLLRWGNKYYLKLRHGIYDAHLHDGECWPEKWAYIALSGRRQPDVSLEVLNARNWELLDSSGLYIHMDSQYGMSRLVHKTFEKHDRDHQYQISQSPLFNELKQRFDVQAALVGLDAQLVVIRSSGVDCVSLGGHENLSMRQRLLATKIFVAVIMQYNRERAEAAKRALFEAHKPLHDLRVVKVGMPELVERLQKSKRLWLMDSSNRREWKDANIDPVEVARGNYGGGRTDRIASRNALTNRLGFPKVSGREFYSIGDENGGTFLADMIRYYGADGEYVVIDNGDVLNLRHDWELADPDPTLGYGKLSPKPFSGHYRGVLAIAKKKLASYEAWRGPIDEDDELYEYC